LYTLLSNGANICYLTQFQIKILTDNIKYDQVLMD